jgi:hypothetical protein
LRRLLGEMRSRLHGFEQPGLDAREAWFTGLSDRDTPTRVRQLVNTTLGDLLELDAALGTSLDLLMTSNVTALLESSQDQADQADRFDRRVALITSALLVPAFLASLFGAEPYAGGHDWIVFGALLAAMIVAGLLTYRFMTRRGR